MEPPQQEASILFSTEVYSDFWFYLYLLATILFGFHFFYSIAGQKVLFEVEENPQRSKLLEEQVKFRNLDQFLFNLTVNGIIARVMLVFSLSLLFLKTIHFEAAWLSSILLFFLLLIVFWLLEFSAQIVAFKRPERLILRGKIFYKIVRDFPLSWLYKLLGSRMEFVGQMKGRPTVQVASGELAKALELTIEEDFSKEEHKIFEGIVKFGNTEARQIMRSRVDMISINRTLNFEEVMAIVREYGYSRVPVFENRQDNVVGVLNIKDLLPFLNEAYNFDWQQLIREPYFIPETKKIDDLLKDFQGMKMHIAIVVDEYGGTSGIVTLEDVLEEILGDISDEFDDDDVVYSKIDETTFVFEGRTSLNDFYRITGVDQQNFEEKKGDAETIGGFIVETQGKILKNNEFIKVGDVKLIVESSDKRRIKLIKVETKYK